MPYTRMTWSGHNRGFAGRATHLYSHDFARLLGFLLYSLVWRKTTKHSIILDSLHDRILNFTWVCVLVFLSLSCSLVIWYELNEKFWDILSCFAMPDCEARKPTWRLRVWWLVKLAWCDVTWKPSKRILLCVYFQFATSIHESQNPMAMERRLTHTGIAGGRSLSI